MNFGPQEAQLSADLLRSTLREVEKSYHEHNASLFGERLRAPLLEWSNLESEWGAWVGGSRILRLSPRLLERPWGHLVEVLKHEMAHQYVEEVLGIVDQTPHGETFQRVCQERGIDARAAGEPLAGIEPPSREVSQLKKITHLLSLAKSENRHEAEAAMAAAQRLMLKYNLEQAVFTSAQGYSFRHVGRPTGRRAAWQRMLASILSEYFFVEVLIVPVYRPREGKRGSVLELMGSVENLEIAAYVHDFLENAAESLWKSHKKQKKLTTQSGRQSFLWGVMSGFYDKLGKARMKSQEEGLIWQGDPALSEYARARYPYVRRVAARSAVEPEAFSAGKEAGQRLVLHRGMREPSSSPVRLLGEGGRS